MNKSGIRKRRTYCKSRWKIEARCLVSTWSTSDFLAALLAALLSSVESLALAACFWDRKGKNFSRLGCRLESRSRVEHEEEEAPTETGAFRGNSLSSFFELGSFDVCCCCCICWSPCCCCFLLDFRRLEVDCPTDGSMFSSTTFNVNNIKILILNRDLLLVYNF